MAGEVVKFQVAPSELRKIASLLDSFEKKVQTKIVRDSFFEAAQIVKVDGVMRAPVGLTGNLANSIKVRRFKRGKEMGAEIVAHVFYAKFVEFGHRIVTRGWRGQGEKQVTGHVPARPFLRPALEHNVEAVINKISGELTTLVQETARNRV